MILRKLSIFGFKSFADKTEIHFGDGMTAVIGPNGCGKSNVVDAIRWVFGEQKASALRSDSMQDVIFSGAERRQPLNMSEVTLTISNTSGILPIEYSEVAITRRIFRSGESEYLINRVPTRLRDIQNLFLDTGIGTTAYTTIENSMINKILSDKAEERRMLFEEAAGIGKFKQRIRESQRKLEHTHQDLIRINDRVQEKDRYVRLLSRQVEKARRYQQYHNDLLKLEVGYENRRYQMLSQAIAEGKRTISGLETTIENLRAQIATEESRIEAMELTKVEKEKDVQLASRNVGDAGERINALDREISVSKQSLSLLKQNITRFDQEIEDFDSQSAQKKELLSSIELSLITRKTQLEEHAHKFAGAQHALEQFDQQVVGQKEKADELNARQLNLVHDAGQKQKEQGNCQTNLLNILEHCQRGEREIERLEEQMEEYRLKLEICKSQLSDAHETFKKHVQTRDTLWSRIEKEDKRYHDFVEREKSVESQLDSSKAKLRFLEGLDAAFEGYSQGVRALLEKNLPGTLGIVADLISVTNQDKIAIVERALGSSIQTVVFRKDVDLREAINFLAREKVGIARMVSLESLKIPEPIIPPDNTMCLRSLVVAKHENTAVADYFLNRILICDTKDTATNLQSRASLDTVIVAKDGTVCYGTGVTVAGTKKKEQVGLLQRKQEIEKLKIDMVTLQKEYDSLVHDKEICIITRDDAKRALIEIDEKLNTGRQVQHEQETDIRHFENEIVTIQERIQNLVPEVAKNRALCVQLEQNIKEHEASLQEIAGARSEIEKQIDRVKSMIAEMDAERKERAEHLKNIELATQGLAHRIEQDTQSIEHLRKDLENLGSSRQKKIADKNNAIAEIKHQEETIVVLGESLARQTAQREDLLKIFEQVREEYAGILNTIEEIRHAIKNLQNELDEYSNRRHGFEVEHTRDEEQKRAIREKIYNSYEIDLESPPENTPLLDSEDVGIIDNIHMLKERIKRVGDVNMSAIHEYEQESAELKNMVIQRDDLQKAVDDLENAIKRLNKEARVQFLATFELVQKNFVDMFTTLFEGGEASLTLEENIDPLEAVININVKPAGKKMRGVTLLSGGERALTAISLLFALYLVKPSAYCILDELDAPLDDANVDRFVRLLRRFSQTTQFIVVTHNRYTMEAADILYGVTQMEKGVSTLASVQLAEYEEAKAA